MRIIIFFSVFITLFLSDELKFNLTIVLSVCWLFYTIYFIFNLKSIKDEKIKTNKFLCYPPNNKESYYIRYLYTGKIDYKAFVGTILELLLKKSISLVRSNNEYYFIDNKVVDEVLNKNEAFVKKILFSDIGINNKVSIENIKLSCKKNSGYIYSIFKEWQNLFLYESAPLKYFKSIKPVVDNSLFYFMISMIIAIYNVFFTEFIWVSLLIFFVTTFLIKSVNDYSNREPDASVEYKSWLEFKNYIRKKDNNIYEMDNKTLENYATYAYALDEYDSFVEILNKKYSKDIKCFDDSILLYIMNLKIFDVIESDIKSSLNSACFKSTVLFSKNKGRV